MRLKRVRGHERYLPAAPGPSGVRPSRPGLPHLEQRRPVPSAPSLSGAQCPGRRLRGREALPAGLQDPVAGGGQRAEAATPPSPAASGVTWAGGGRGGRAPGDAAAEERPARPAGPPAPRFPAAAPALLRPLT